MDSYVLLNKQINSKDDEDGMKMYIRILYLVYQQGWEESYSPEKNWCHAISFGELPFEWGLFQVWQLQPLSVLWIGFSADGLWL